MLDRISQHGLLVLTLLRLRAYFAALNVVLIILFSPITQATVDLQTRQRNLGPDTGSVAMTTAYTIANPPGQRTCTCHTFHTYSNRPGFHIRMLALMSAG